MQLPKVVIVGGGGHAKVIIDILQNTQQYEVIGYTSPDEGGKSLLGVPYLGDDSILPFQLQNDEHYFFVAVGDNKLRKKLFEKLIAGGFNTINAISLSAHISSHATIGQGVVIMPGAVVNASAVIGDNVIINTLAGVDHDCQINSHSHIAPGVSISGGVTIGTGSFIGTGTCVIPEVSIGDWVVIGAGSAVVNNIQSNAKVVGVPAKKYI